nr:flavin reductase family protein [Nocardia carnea]
MDRRAERYGAARGGSSHVSDENRGRCPQPTGSLPCARPGRKDSLRNVLDTGEFVVCLATEPMFERVNATGTDFPAELSEFTEVGLTPERSATVAPPRVAESPVALECRLEQTLELGDSTVVIGRVVHAAIDTGVLHTDARGNSLPAIERLRPLARLGRNEWSTIGRVLEIARIPHEKWPGDFRREG